MHPTQDQSTLPNSSFEQGKCIRREEDYPPDQQELSQILRDMRQALDPMGITSLGADGVFRYLTADRDVIDAVGLRPGLIKALLDRMPFSQDAEDKFRGVDGTLVPREQWFNPDKGLLPPPLPEEKREQVRKRMAEGGEDFLKRFNDPNRPRCPLVLRSNYNLDPKEEAAAVRS
ncbi:hypothetical protein Asppvi_003680 [Aspergillus pseudoviridinutans]|uniref:Uncharacterized protein n=1 Tax=Aspergillus pseudoviridinutans TaxID=1517512 RepID=A0A9P3B7G9_9EURO|nr:uncharacterized protein Asppvi_003680 [Aspergillus pseudoviridinutans]GIJ84829.1 hypothetical protein Asppvi_003680 [Aspergillus pseudoviridinutans]